MIYANTIPATFLSRPNRFIAHVRIHEKTVIAHVKNTGRCKEILVPGAKVIVQESNNPERKTKYDHVTCFTPNKKTHPAFAEALIAAEQAGVRVMALDCMVTENSLAVGKSVVVKL